MRRHILGAVTAAGVAILMNVPTPVLAQVAGPGAAPILNTAAEAKGPVTNVRWRGHRWRGHHWRGHRWHHRPWRYGYWHRGYGWGPAVGAGIAGLFLGGALAAQAQASGSAIDWCDQRYRSYDRASQTYLGYDGYRHSCP